MGAPTGEGVDKHGDITLTGAGQLRRHGSGRGGQAVARFCRAPMPRMHACVLSLIWLELGPGARVLSSSHRLSAFHLTARSSTGSASSRSGTTSCLRRTRSSSGTARGNTCCWRKTRCRSRRWQRAEAQRAFRQRQGAGSSAYVWLLCPYSIRHDWACVGLTSACIVYRPRLAVG